MKISDDNNLYHIEKRNEIIKKMVNVYRNQLKQLPSEKLINEAIYLEVL